MLSCTRLREWNILCLLKFVLSKADSFTTLILTFEISKVVGPRLELSSQSVGKKKRLSYHQLCFPISQDVDVCFKIWLQILKEQNLFVYSIRMRHCNIAMKITIDKSTIIRIGFLMVARRSKAVRVEKEFLSHRRINMEDIKQRYAHVGNLLRAEISFSEHVLQVLGYK